MRVNLFFTVGRDPELEKRVIGIHAYFAPTDDVPLILGFKDLLARFPHHFDFVRNVAYIEA